MAVQKIEEYRMKNGSDILKVYCKPTKKFPEGRNYFYCDADAIDLVQSHTWYLSQHNKNIYVEAHNWRTTCDFHQELAYKYLNYYPSYIDHCNLCGIDNIDSNLNEVTNQQNIYNQPTRGYCLKYNSFQPYIGYNQKILTSSGVVHSEFEACTLQHELETSYLKELMDNEYYMYNFLLDRRNDLDILDLERTGKINSDEAIYRHVLRYAGNAWYYYRYGLENYFRQNNIPVPNYSLDEQGFMIHPVTGQKLCPF